MTDLLLRLFAGKHRDLSQPAARAAYGNLASIVGILCNLLLFAGKFLAGLLSGSVAVSADAFNNLSDASSNVISLVGFRLGSMPADAEHPFGHARYEYLAGLAVSVLVLTIGVELGKESVKKIMAPAPVDFSALTAAILVASILVKLWMSAFNRTLGKAIHSETLLATAADSRNDVISTAAVLVSAVLMRLTGVAAIDGWMGLGVAIFILYSGVGLVRDTLSPLLGKAPDAELVEHITKTVLGYSGVLGIHDLMVHDYGPGQRFASLHVELPAESPPLETHDLIDNIERDFLVRDGIRVTIHYDPVVTTDPHVTELRHFLEGEAARLGPHYSIHDLRIVPGATHTNVVFDFVIPAGQRENAQQLKEQLERSVQQRWPDHFCVLRLEHSYTPSTDDESKTKGE